MPSRTRLLFVITQFDTGGVQFQLWLRLTHLDPSRYDCRVAVLTGGESYLLDRVRGLGVPVDMLHIDTDRALWRRVRRVRQYIASVQPDVVDTLLMWDNVYGTAAAALAGVPCIVAELQNNRESVRRSYSPGFRALEAFALRFLCDHVVCCSQAVFDSYARVFPGFGRKASVIHDAIDITQPIPPRAQARQALGLPADAPIVGTIGRLVEQKDHDTLLRAASRLVALHPEALIVIAGYGPLHDRLVAQRERLCLSDRVRFLGEITNPYLFYAAVDVFAMTSRWEGFPVVLLEAMSAGLPVVSTRVGGIAEAITHGTSGLLAEAGDERTLAASMAALLDNQVMRSRIGAAARQEVARYGIHELIACWRHLYGQGGRPRQVAGTPAAVSVPGPVPPGLALPERATRILVWRLCPMGRLLTLVTDVRRRYPDAEIDCVCQSNAADSVCTAGMRPIPYGDGRFTARRLGPAALFNLRRRHYDLVLVPFNQPTREGYAAAEWCAAWAGRGPAYGMSAWSDQVEPVAALTPGSVIAHRWLGSPRLLRDAVLSALTLVRGAVARRAVTS